MKFAVTDDPFRLLAISGRDLEQTLEHWILAFGADAVPHLYALAERDFASDEDWPRVHAVRLLIKLGIEQTFDRLLRIFLRTFEPDWDDYEQWEVFINCCPSLGRPFLDRVFALLDKEPEHMSVLAPLVYEFDRDPRIEALLDELAETDPECATSLLYTCEDARRLPLMLKTIENLVRSGSRYVAVLDLADAIGKLGGALPQDVSAGVMQARIRFYIKNRFYPVGAHAYRRGDDPKTLN